MINLFLFSKNHLILLLLFSAFLYISPRLTKNLLPHSYFVEKIICLLLIFEVILEQIAIYHYGDYNVLYSLPIEISKFTAYICLLILLCKQYQLFNIFFSWSLVCSIGELILIKNLPYECNAFFSFLYLISKCLLIYSNVYMIEVRKFRINKYAIRDNFIMCAIYFSFIILLNNLTLAHYPYAFLKYDISSIFIFIFLTTVIYIPLITFKKENSNFKSNKRGKG